MKRILMMTVTLLSVSCLAGEQKEAGTHVIAALTGDLDTFPISRKGQFYEFVAKNGACGSLFIKPKEFSTTPIRIESKRATFYSPTSLTNVTIQDLGSWEFKDKEGFIVTYDEGGDFARYRILCLVPEANSIKFERINCDEVIGIQDVKHDIPCDTLEKESPGSLALSFKTEKKLNADEKTERKEESAGAAPVTECR